MRRASSVPIVSIALVALVAAVALVVPASVAGAANGNTAAGRVLVTTADLPAGWTTSAHDSAGDDETARALAACVGTPVAKKVVTVTGDDITDPSGNLFVSSAVALYKSTAIAKKQFTAYTSSAYGDCAQQYFANKPFGGATGPLPTGVQVSKVSLRALGQDRVGWALRADVPKPDSTTVSIYSVQAAVLKGRAIVKTQFDSIDTQFPQDQGEAVLAKVAPRIRKAKL